MNLVQALKASRDTGAPVVHGSGSFAFDAGATYNFTTAQLLAEDYEVAASDSHALGEPTTTAPEAPSVLDQAGALSMNEVRADRQDDTGDATAIKAE